MALDAGAAVRLSAAATLTCELRAVVALMRQNSKWALVPGYGGYAEEDVPDDPLLDAFRTLRRALLGCTEAAVQPAACVAPFLEVVRSVETSGPITGTALSAVFKILTRGVVSPGSPDAAAVMHSIADAVTHCRFEATDAAADAAVLSKILQVLLAALTCPTGHLLTDDDVCNVVQASYRIGHQSSKEGDLLEQMSRHVLSEVVRVVFSGLAALPEEADVGAGRAAGGAGPASPNGALSRGAASNGEGSSEAPAAGAPYGLPCMVEIFQFLVSLIGLEDGRAGDDLCVLGLSLCTQALEAGGEAFAAQPALLQLVLGDMCRAVVSVASHSANLSVLTHCCNAMLLLYIHLRPHCKVQLLVWLKGALLPLGEGRGVAFEHQRAALEGVVDLCRLPAFVTDLYTNFDCDLSMANLFEELTSLLSKNAFPVNCPLSAIHLLSLEGLLAVVHSVADRSGSVAAPPEGPAAPLSDPERYEDIWEVDPSSVSPDDPRQRADTLKRIKYIKRRLIAGADHFNRKPKKGLEFLQEIKLLPAELVPSAVAAFLRRGPGLDKGVVGEYLGDNKDFPVEVLKCYAKTFDFGGMNLERALRMFLNGFVLPGEAQKIARILEAFAERFYQHNPGDVADQDSAYVLSYSIIMLNTDAHNKQVKNKMTLEQFVKNNRGTNGGKDWPRETLVEIYDTITTDEIKITSDKDTNISTSSWLALIRGYQGQNGQRLCPVPSAAAAAMFDGDLFAIIWGPAIAAISVVFDHAEDESVLREALDGFLAVARIASAHRMSNVIDNLVASLCKFTALLNPTASPAVRPSVAFGEDTKARMAAVTVFSVANKHGDTLREGWCNILDCVLRMHKLGMLPTKESEEAGGDAGDGTPLLRPQKAVREARSVSTSGTGGVLRSMSSGFTSLLGLDGGPEAARATPSEREAEAEQRTARCVEACRIDEVFSDSKFLEGESLLELCKALVWAAGAPGRGGAGGVGGASPQDEDTALFCLELLIHVTLRNRDRILLLWPMVHDHLKAIVQSAKSGPSPLVERAMTDLLRIAQRLVPYKEELADELLLSLRLVFSLDARVAEGLMERVATEVLALVKAAAGHIRSPAGWDTVCKLLMGAARHADGSAAGFEALRLVVGGGAHVLDVNFALCLEACLTFAEARAGGPERSAEALGLLTDLGETLGRWAGALRAEGRHPNELLGMWGEVVKGLRAPVLEERAEVREAAVAALQRVLAGAGALSPPPELWLQVYADVLLPLLGEAVELARREKASGADRTVRLLVSALLKTLLQEAEGVAPLPQFVATWHAALDRCAEAVKGVRTEEVAEAVPELLKGTLLVMASKGVLAETGGPPGMWEGTWQRAAAVSPALKPAMLAEQG